MVRFIKMEYPNKYVNIDCIIEFEVIKNFDRKKWEILAKTNSTCICNCTYKSFDREKEAREALRMFMDEINGNPLTITHEYGNDVFTPTDEQLKEMKKILGEE